MHVIPIDPCHTKSSHIKTLLAVAAGSLLSCDMQQKAILVLFDHVIE